MSTVHWMPLVAVLLTLSGCSGESLKKVGYDTLQNMREQQCQKELSADCSERTGYEEYQKRMKELDDSR